MEQKRVGRIFRLIGTFAILSIALALIAGLTLQQHKVASACSDNISIDALDGGGYYADISSSIQAANPGAFVTAQGTYTYSNVRTGVRLGSDNWWAPSLITLPLPPQGQQVMYDYQFTGTIYVDGNPQGCASGFIDIGS